MIAIRRTLFGGIFSPLWIALWGVLLAVAASGQPVNVTLGASPAPSTGQPGVTNLVLVAAGLPSGVVASNIIVSFAPATAGSGPSATALANLLSLVTGSTYRLTVLMPATLVVSAPTSYNISISGNSPKAFASTNSSKVTVNPVASLASINPAFGQQGATVNINIVGNYTNFVQNGTSANFGAGITVNPATVQNATQASVQIKIDPNATVGPRDVVITTGNQSATLKGAFAVTSAVTTTPPPNVTITSPAPQALFSKTPITVTGTVSDSKASVTVNGVAAVVSGLNYTATNVPLKEGVNLVTATAANTGGSAGTASIQVTLDTTPPRVVIDAPTDGASTTAPTVNVTGIVNDIVPGTVNLGEVTVMVNGVAAMVSNRTFVAQDVLLTPGVNTITAIATDKAGNQGQALARVTLQNVAGQQHLSMLSGNGQTAQILTTLPNPLVVIATDAIGNPVKNLALTFTVRRSDGVLTATGQSGATVTAQTDSQGRASVQFKVGSRVGVGMNEVDVSSPGFSTQVIFSEDATVGPPARINVVMGDGQRGEVGKSLPEPFALIVTDAGGNPVSGAPVTFNVIQGGGNFGSLKTSVTFSTDADGKAAAVLTLGQQEGISNNIVSVNYLGNSGASVMFAASGVVPGTAANTSVSGIVLDNSNNPVPGATAKIVNSSQLAKTDANGRFTITGAPVGGITLIVDGSTSTRTDAKFPFLAFTMLDIAGQNNTLGMPIQLPPLDLANPLAADTADCNHDTVLQMKGVPGYKFTIKACSATFPDGTHTGVISLSQVAADKVPMPPPNGTAPRVFGTLQPANVHFNPPVAVQFPNTDGLPPGTVVDITSFDHDLEQFVTVGTARVSADGSVIVSDPGFGIPKSGWHGPLGPPPPKTCTLSCNSTNDCKNSTLDSASCSCVSSNKGDGTACGSSGNSSCNNPGTCKGGACSGGPKSAGTSCDDGIFCTDPDTCDGSGACKGTKIEDGHEESLSWSTNLMDPIKNAINNGVVKKLFPTATFTVTFDGTVKKQFNCCEAKKQKDVLKATLEYSATGQVGLGPEVIPGLGFNLHAIQFGIAVGLQAGVKAGLRVIDDKCDDKLCWGGFIQPSAAIQLGVKAEAAGVVSIFGGGQAGLEGNVAVNCKEYEVDLKVSDVLVVVTVSFFDGWFTQNFQHVVYPGFPLLGGTYPLPDPGN